MAGKFKRIVKYLLKFPKRNDDASFSNYFTDPATCMPAHRTSPHSVPKNTILFEKSKSGLLTKDNVQTDYIYVS